MSPICFPSLERCLHCKLPDCSGGKDVKGRGIAMDRSESFAMQCGNPPKYKASKKDATIPYLTGSVGGCARVGSNMHSVGKSVWCSAMLE